MEFRTENIVKWLSALPEEHFVALMAHAQDGKLSYTSCSCLIGSRTAPHALGVSGEYCDSPREHVDVARMMPFGEAAEKEFFALGFDGVNPSSDEIRRERLMPLLLAEQDRRAQSTTGILDAEVVAGVA